MQMFLLKMSQMLMGMPFLGTGATGNEPVKTFQDSVITPIVNLIDALLVPLMILVGAAGSIYAIVLGVQFAKAETSDKREEAKKRLINAVIGIVIIFVLLFILKLFTVNMDGILKSLGYGSK